MQVFMQVQAEHFRVNCIWDQMLISENIYIRNIYCLGVCQLWKMLDERFFVQCRLCNLQFAWLCLIDKCVLFIFILLSLNILYLYTICSPLNPCLLYNFTLIFKCVPQILGSCRYSYIQASVLVIVDYFPKNPKAEFLWFLLQNVNNASSKYLKNDSFIRV